MNKFIRLSIVVLLVLPHITRAVDGKTLIIVTRNYTPRPASEQVSIVVDYKSLVDKVPQAAAGFSLNEGNFGKGVTYRLFDGNKDGAADQVVIDFTFTSDEPVYSFSVVAGKDRQKIESGSHKPNERLVVTCLFPSTRWLKDNGQVSWPDKIIQSTMAFYPDPATLPLYAPGNYSYEYAFFLNAMLLHGQQTKNESYHAYVKKWADRYLDAQGKLDPKYYDAAQYQLDHLLPGRTFLSLYQIDRNEKYKTAADQLMSQLQMQPKTKDGGYWHKQVYPNQMWLDGIYMADVFATQYGAAFNKPDAFADATKQINLIWNHTYDKSKGLMYHGWDESLNKVWADPVKGTSPEFWSRAIGWYLMAIVECSDYIPTDHPDWALIDDRFEEICNSLRGYQDKKSWLWYQVTDKGAKPGNWIETSGSAMIAYAFAKGERKGLLDVTHRAAADEAFDTLIDDYVYFDSEGKLYLDQTVKIGTLNIKNSKGDYDYYITTERRINDYKGLGALLYLSLEMD